MPNNADLIRAATESGTDWGALLATVAVVAAVLWGLLLLRSIGSALWVIATVLGQQAGHLSEVRRELSRIRHTEERRGA